MSQKKDNYFLLYSNCFVVVGWQSCMIYDIQLSRYKFISLGLYPIINQAKEKSIRSLLQLYEKKYHAIIIDEFKELVKEGLGFYTDNPSQFPNIDLTWDHPSIISNAIIDWSNVAFNPQKINDLIEGIGCEAIQVIVPTQVKRVEMILEQFKESRIKSIQLLIDYVSNNHSEKIVSLAEKYLRVFFIYFYGSSEYKEFTSSRGNLRITYIDTDVKAVESYNIKVDRWPLIINIPFFTESQKHHTYFNRKIYIAKNGDIKNAPESKEIIGNINSNSTDELMEAIKVESNQRYWYVSKDLCDVCKHCEYRYMCMDNRVPYQRKDGGWYHKEECNYNPYISKWKGDKKYKSLSECGVTSDRYCFFIDYLKVEQINKEIW